MTYFEVKQSVELNDDEKLAVENKEALFFYHSWIRTDFELIEIAHYMLLDLEAYGLLICNYKETSEYKTVECLLKQVDKLNTDGGKVRLNCPFTGKFNWIDSRDMSEIFNDLIWALSSYIDDAYNLPDYYCSFLEGDWGLWPVEQEDCLY